ncbi:NAD(P)H-dependent oxidoreductase [Thalassotalea ganghwensis]
MEILIISGSQRAQGNSIKVADYLQTHMMSTLENANSSILDLSQYEELLKHYGSGVDDNSLLNEQKQQVLDQLYRCDAVVFIAPEWGGMIPPALVNLILLTANGSAGGLPLGHKPAFAVGISASSGGSNPISMLKAYAAKNSHLTWLPLHAIITNVEQFLQAPWQPEASDRISQVQSRLQVGIEALVIYAERLIGAREKLVKLSKKHPFGQ